MIKTIIKTTFTRLLRNENGGFAMESALMFGALAVVGALLAAPLLDKASRQYAGNTPYGIDPVTTASTGVSSRNGNIYTIRKSVLNRKETVICRTANGYKC